MYESFYGFKEKPFNLLPDPDYLYMSHGHENAYTHLEYAISENKGFVVITGEIGSGKTTLINYLLRKIQQDTLVGIVTHTDVPPEQFIKVICQEFELRVDGLDKAEMIDSFNDYLVSHFASRKRVVLIIDESQNLPNKTLEEIRMLSNLESEKHHLLQIILVGQPELKFKIMRSGMEQFAQRVTVHCHLDGLEKEEVASYIRHRLNIAGASNLDVFAPDAIEAVHDYSRGIPRVINILCDTALVYGFADEMMPITRSLVETIVKEKKDSGIFFQPSDEGQTPADDVPAANVISDAFESKIRHIEGKVRLLENTIGSMDRRLNSLLKRKTEKDDVTLELFKMLKDSMESRMRLILKMTQISHRKRIKPEDTAQKASQKRSSFFSRRKGNP